MSLFLHIRLSNLFSKLSCFLSVFFFFSSLFHPPILSPFIAFLTCSFFDSSLPFPSFCSIFFLYITSVFPSSIARHPSSYLSPPLSPYVLRVYLDLLVPSIFSVLLHFIALFPRMLPCKFPSLGLVVVLVLFSKHQDPQLRFFPFQARIVYKANQCIKMETKV